MNLEYLRELISNIAVITTVLQFLSGVLVCKQYVAKCTTADASPLPFICCMLSCAFWLLYGLVKQDSKIVLVNTIGILLMASYTVVFYFYTIKKTLVLKQLCAMIVILLITIKYVYSETNHDLLVNHLGLLCCSLTLLTIIAPMSKLFHVIKVKSTECLPFPMILMSFFVSMLWFLYGVIIEDSYLQMPNFIGAVLALMQLSLFILYPNTSLPNKGILPS